ncbi:MAG: hypothetical protein Q4B26_10975 [Eubacteriales bacterium]|nr:hypothetical protein [Eubacteriales bacterium]
MQILKITPELLRSLADEIEENNRQFGLLPYVIPAEPKNWRGLDFVQMSEETDGEEDRLLTIGEWDD